MKHVTKSDSDNNCDSVLHLRLNSLVGYVLPFLVDGATVYSTVQGSCTRGACSVDSIN